MTENTWPTSHRRNTGIGKSLTLYLKPMHGLLSEPVYIATVRTHLRIGSAPSLPIDGDPGFLINHNKNSFFGRIQLLETTHSLRPHRLSKHQLHSLKLRCADSFNVKYPSPCSLSASWFRQANQGESAAAGAVASSGPPPSPAAPATHPAAPVGDPTTTPTTSAAGLLPDAGFNDAGGAPMRTTHPTSAAGISDTSAESQVRWLFLKYEISFSKRLIYNFGLAA